MRRLKEVALKVIKYVLPYGFYRLYNDFRERGAVFNIKSSSIPDDAQRFWTKSQQSNMHQDLSHWRGVGRFSEEKWLNIGATHLRFYNELVKLSKKSIEKGISVLEWGGGGGANAWAFCKDLEAQYYDIDISMPNLLEAEKQVNILGKGGFAKIFLKNPIDFNPVTSLNNRKFDFILSTAVFQHFPSEKYGIDVVRTMAQLIKEDGLFIIQTRFCDNSTESKSKKTNYNKNALGFTSYGIQAFRGILESENFKVLDMFFVDEDNYCYYMGECKKPTR